MKKLICALVLLAMLVPVAAMAVDSRIPQELDLKNLNAYESKNGGVKTEIAWENRGVKSIFKYTLKETEKESSPYETAFESMYFMNGRLAEVRYFFDCGCVLLYSRSGVLQFDPMQKGCGGEHPVPVDFDEVETNRPAEDVLSYVSGYDTVQELVSDLESISITDANTQNALNSSDSLKRNGDVFLKYSSSTNELQYAFIGSAVYDKEKGFFRVYGDAENNSKAWAQYDIDNDRGALNHYAIFAPDGTKEIAYSSKNQVKSIEIWDENSEYWGYGVEDNTWEHSATGMYEDAVKVKNEDVPESILEEVLVAPGTAAFSVTTKSDVAEVEDEDKGAPVVIGGLAANTVAEMEDIHTSVYQMNVQPGSSFNEPISLLLPYAPGQNQDIAQRFTYTVEHKHDNGKVDNYSTEPTKASEMTMTFTENGVLVSGVSTFSPFTVTWGPKQASTTGMDSLPSTGDSSNLLAYACLLLASAAMFVMLKRRAHQ